jgi:hypothetical protein
MNENIDENWQFKIRGIYMQLKAIDLGLYD